MKLYYVNEAYIAYLSSFDSKVCYNKNTSRPYVGIVLEINEQTYFAPLTSPKNKHTKMKSSLTCFKINDGIYGAVNLNNMIPVRLNNVERIDFDLCSISYKNLLENQIQFLNHNKLLLLKQAKKLHGIARYNSTLERICCNFKLLEQKCQEYQS